MTVASGPSVGAARRRGTTPATAACSICVAMHGAARDYVARVLCDPQHVNANAEAIADAVGFCPRHAAFIAGFEGGAEAIAAVLQQAMTAVLALFDGRPGAEDRLRDVLFAAPEACPACAFEDRRLAALLGRHAVLLRRHDRRAGTALCQPHFHGLIAESELPDLRQWAAMESACLSAAAAALDEAGPGALTAATRLMAGPRTVDAPGSLPGGCRVCEAMSAARKRWLMLVRESIRTDAAPEMLLPLCAEHLWLSHSSDDARLADRATRNALEISARRLRQAAAKLEDEERRLERSKASVWYRAKSPAYVLGQRRRIVTDMPRCPACERVAVARDRTIAQALEQARDGGERAAGLCMKHFAYARVIAPAGALRESLTRAQVKQLRSLARELSVATSVSRQRALFFLSGTAC